MAKKANITRQEEELFFFYEVGKAITKWANVEYTLYLIATNSVSKDDFGNLAHGFFALDSFYAKLSFTSAMLRAKFHDSSYMDHWDSLVVRCTQVSRLRNALAHGAVFRYEENETTPGRRLTLGPWVPRSDPLSQRAKPKPQPKKKGSGTRGGHSCASARRDD